jgi:hypothetical protein
MSSTPTPSGWVASLQQFLPKSITISPLGQCDLREMLDVEASISAKATRDAPIAPPHRGSCNRCGTSPQLRGESAAMVATPSASGSTKSLLERAWVDGKLKSIDRNAVLALVRNSCWHLLFAALVVLTSCGGRGQADASSQTPGSGGTGALGGGAGFGGKGGEIAQAGSAGSGQGHAVPVAHDPLDPPPRYDLYARDQGHW